MTRCHRTPGASLKPADRLNLPCFMPSIVNTPKLKLDKHFGRRFRLFDSVFANILQQQKPFNLSWAAAKETIRTQISV